MDCALKTQRLHDEGPHGTRHGRIVKFLLDHEVETVVINHAGPPMLNTVRKIGLTVVEAVGTAREAALLAATRFRVHGSC